MSRSKELELKLSSIRSRLNALSSKDSLSDEERSESETLQKEHPDVESRYRSALIAEEEEAEKREQEVIVNDPPEHRERVELRSRASLVNYVTSAIRGRAVTGAEAELMAAAGVDGIPLELWDTAPVTEARRAVLRSQYEKRAATPAPATATRTADVSIVVGPATYQLSAKTFRDIATADLGNTAFSDYAMSMYGAWWTNRRMPAPASNYQQAIVYRSGRMTMPMTMRTACAPHWGYLTIDDLYSGSASGTRFFTSHVLLGDVLLVQPDAYAQVQYRVA